MYICLAVANMRGEPSHESKVVSQALFGEKVELLSRHCDWAHIQTPDLYTGWVLSKNLVDGSHYEPDLEVTRLSAHIYPIQDIEYGPIMTLPYGAKLKLLDSSDSRWNGVILPDGRKLFIQKGDVKREAFDLATFGHKFLGVPYTWGGRSSFGFDCSGFIQMVYSKMGVQLPRDAREQILDPRAKKSADPKLGNLIFWGKSESDIRHVGMFLKGDEFIHTSSRENKPYLRLSKLSDFEWSGQRGSSYPFRCFCKIDIV